MPKITRHRRTYGQFFTPRPVVECCYALLDGLLPAAPRIVDPACGDGAFLRYAAERAIAAPDRIAGCDVDPALVGALAAAGLDGVRLADGLDPTSLPGASFDLAIGNPPFGIAATGGDPGKDRLASEVLFLLRALDLARPGGYVALVLPSGVLANERLRALRAGLLARCAPLAIVALPRATFRDTGTNAACSILLLRNAPAPPGHQVFFALPERLEELPQVVEAYRSRSEIGARRSEPARQAAQSPISNLQSLNTFWLPQTAEMAGRMDAAFWRPDQRALLERLAARHPLRALGEVLEPRRDLIVGDHVRPSRGEARGAGLHMSTTRPASSWPRATTTRRSSAATSGPTSACAVPPFASTTSWCRARG